MPKKYKYHMNCPEGEVFDVSPEQEKDMTKDGWADSPADLDLPKASQEVAAEIAAALSPSDIAAKCREFGYIVLTPDELEAEKNKAVFEAMKDSSPSLKAAAGDDTEETAEESEAERLERVFFQNPTDLTKKELKQYASDRFDLTLSMTMKEATMIEKITEAKAAADQEGQE